MQNPNVIKQRIDSVNKGIESFKLDAERALGPETEAAFQRSGHFPGSESIGLTHRGDSLKLEDRIEARDLLNKDALERSGIPAHIGEDALKGAEVIPFRPESTVEQPQEKAA